MTKPMPHRFPAITFAALAAELAGEAQARITTRARELERGRMAPADVAREAALVAAWQEDCRRMAALAPGQNPNAAQPRHGLTWRARVQGIERELQLRAKHYPAWIEQGRMTQQQAAHQVQCLTVLQAFYLDGLDWPEDPDTRAALYAEAQATLHPETQQRELTL